MTVCDDGSASALKHTVLHSNIYHCMKSIRKGTRTIKNTPCFCDICCVFLSYDFISDVGLCYDELFDYHDDEIMILTPHLNGSSFSCKCLFNQCPDVYVLGRIYRCH